MERLAKLLKVSESVAYTCETAAHFWLLHVLARWEKFCATAQAAATKECVQGEQWRRRAGEEGRAPARRCCRP